MRRQPDLRHRRHGHPDHDLLRRGQRDENHPHRRQPNAGIHDYDHDDHGHPELHPHDLNGGHHHDWNNGKRGDSYAIEWQKLAGVALITVCVVGCAIIAIDDISGVGICDDFLLGPLGSGLVQGFNWLFK